MNISPSSLYKLTGVQSFGADVDDTTIFRYQPGGDLYSSVMSMFGAEGADKMAAAASSGSRVKMNSSMSELRGNPKNTGSTSVLGNFFTQLGNDPLKAPIAAALGQGSSGPGLGKNTTGNLVKGAAAIAVIGLVLYGLNTYKGLRG